MGEFRLCENRRAKNPFFHETMAVHLYTIEELCYYMETNLYLLDESWIGDPLFRWLGEELRMEKLAGRLHQTYVRTKDFYACAALIFQESGYYTEKELEKLDSLLESMRGKTAMERRKMRGDRLLKAKKYRQAAYNYLELLQPDHMVRMTEELQGNIMHNLGVAYANLFLFEEAAEMFASAYRKRKSAASREAYLYALNYVPDTYPMDEHELEINFGVMRDALGKFTDVSDNADFYRERKDASAAAAAFDWRRRQTDLVRRWRDEYENMVT